MASIVIDRGRGPEILGTRITVYNLLPYFFDPEMTEESIAALYDLTPEQVAAARAHVFIHADTVLAEHLKIETRMQAGNPREVIETAERTHETFQRFREWLAERGPTGMSDPCARPDSDRGESPADRLPSFREWLAERERRAGDRP